MSDHSPARVLYSFLTLANVQQRGPVIGSMEHQIGDPVTAWIETTTGQPPLGVEVWVIGVHVDYDRACFDLAFPVAGHPELYMPMRHFQGRITKRGVDYDGVPQLQALDNPAPPAPSAEPTARPTLRLVTAAAVPDMGEASAELVDQLPERDELPGDDQPVYLSFPTQPEQYVNWASRWIEQQPDSNKILRGTSDGRIIIGFPDRLSSMTALTSFLKIRQGLDEPWEVKADGTFLRVVGVAQYTTVQYPMTDAVWVELAKKFPKDSVMHLDSMDDPTFQVTFSSRTEALREVERFAQLFPALADQVKLLAEEERVHQ